MRSLVAWILRDSRTRPDRALLLGFLVDTGAPAMTGEQKGTARFLCTEYSAELGWHGWVCLLVLPEAYRFTR